MNKGFIYYTFDEFYSDKLDVEMYPQQSTRWTSIGNLNKNLEIIQQLREFQRMWCEYFMASFPEILRGSKIWKIRNRENSYLRHRDALSGSISNDGISHLFNSFNFWLKLSYFHPRRESHWTCILHTFVICKPIFFLLTVDSIEFGFQFSLGLFSFDPDSCCVASVLQSPPSLLYIRHLLPR